MALLTCLYAVPGTAPEVEEERKLTSVCVYVGWGGGASPGLAHTQKHGGARSDIKRVAGAHVSSEVYPQKREAGWLRAMNPSDVRGEIPLRGGWPTRREERRRLS